jgi:cAMP phosphodiesterase
LTNVSGHFLLLRPESSGPLAVRVWSPMFFGARQQQCSLEMWLFMSNMSHSTLILVGNSTKQWVVKETLGNNKKLWEMVRYKIGPIRQNFSLILEVATEDAAHVLVAIDNLQLVDCFDHDSQFSSFA